MKRVFIFPVSVAFTVISMAAAKPLDLKSLPQAVQTTVQSQLQGAEIKNISKETENGVTQYEIETMLNGKHRDFNVDTKGALVVVEEEVPLDSLPAAAIAAIRKKVGAGKPGMVEAVKKGDMKSGSETVYEAAYTTVGGKKQVVYVKADGTATKE